MERVIGYGIALVVAGLAEALLVWRLGAPAPWIDGVRAIGAGILLVIVLDGLTAIARRIERRAGLLLAGALGTGFLLLPGPLRLFERIALGPEQPAPLGAKPELLLLSGLPLAWSERGVEATLSDRGGNAAFALLARDFRIRPIDRFAAPARGTLLLAAQPRAMAPAELVALDGWVRNGARALLLTDPDVRWPSDLPRGDPRRPPTIQALAPLLAHWGLEVRAKAKPAIVVHDAGAYRVALDSPGAFVVRKPSCKLIEAGLAADCRIGRGRALILADADLLHDDMWLGPGPPGATRLGRAADNPLLLASWLDALAGAPRDRSSESVAWRKTDDSRFALLAGFAPVLLVLLAGVGMWLRAGRARSRTI